MATSEDARAQLVGELLLAHRFTLAVADAASAGRLADVITDIPGGSAYFLGGIVPYDNASKTRLLGVPEALLSAHGAVSPEVAEAMARSVRDAFRADIGLASTGMLGPSGGTAEKPAGLAWLAIVGPTARVRVATSPPTTAATPTRPLSSTSRCRWSSTMLRNRMLPIRSTAWYD